MKFLIKSSFLHELLHISLAVSFVSFIVFSENLFAEQIQFSSQASLPLSASISASSEGNVYKIVSFEKEKLKGENDFFGEESFALEDDGNIEVKFSDFTTVRADKNAEFDTSVSSDFPEIALDSGRMWVSTKEYVVTNLDQAKVESLAGTTLIEKEKNGNTTVTAWNYPTRITFFSSEGEILWQFLLPTAHKVSFSPREYFSKEEFSKFRFSKLKKEFPIKKAIISEFIQMNILKDESWKRSVVESIENQKSTTIAPFTENFFSFSPNSKNALKKNAEQHALMIIWKNLDTNTLSNFRLKITNFSHNRKLYFYKYFAFFSENSDAEALFEKSIPLDKTGNLWKQLWIMESLLKNEGDNDRQNETRKQIITEINANEYDPEEIQFFAASLFRNYSESISYAAIDFFYDVNTLLIASEPEEKQLTRKLEIIQDVFSFTNDLIEKREYLLARKTLDTVERYIKDDTSPFFAEKRKQILEQKDYVRGRVEYAEILGDNDEKKFNSYLALKNQIKNHEENGNIHAAPPEAEYTVEKAKVFLKEEYEIVGENIIQKEFDSPMFYLVDFKNSDNVHFSATINIEKKESSQTIFTTLNGDIVDIATDYVFDLKEVSDLSNASLDAFLAKGKEDIPSVQEGEKENIPSEISDFVYTLSQNNFIKNDLLVTSSDIDVIRINTAAIQNAIPHYSAREIQKTQELLRKQRGKAGEYSLVSGTRIFEEYTIDFYYNTETKKAYNIVGHTEDEDIPLSGEMFLPDVLADLDEKVRFIREKKELKEQTVLFLKSLGIDADVKNVLWKDKETIEIKNMKERTTGVIFEGVYNPSKQIFSSLTLLNISERPVVLSNFTTLDDLKKDFSLRKDVLKESVEKFNTLKKLQDE